MRRLALLTWMALAGCATGSGDVPPSAPSPAPVAAQAEPSADVTHGDVEERPAASRAVPSHHRVHAMELRVMILESLVSALAVERELELTDRRSCAFYWNPGDRPARKVAATSWRLTKDDLDRFSTEIDETRAGIADPSDLAAFDSAVTERFRAVRARIDAMNRR